MEILTYVMEGALEHKDSIGTTSVIRPGEVQRMSAGKGILHSEFNHSQEQPVHLLQIWILPEEKGIKPSYDQKKISKEPGKLNLIASKKGGEGTVSINQDVNVYVLPFAGKGEAELKLDKDRVAYLQVAKGEVKVNAQDLSNGDSAAVEDEKSIKISGSG